jgi:hypothetical protein
LRQFRTVIIGCYSLDYAASESVQGKSGKSKLI